MIVITTLVWTSLKFSLWVSCQYCFVMLSLPSAGKSLKIINLLKVIFPVLVFVIFIQTREGLPALLVYKSGQIIGNFVKLEDTFGHDFFASDVESFLIE